jgi:hypothetical protein
MHSSMASVLHISGSRILAFWLSGEQFLLLVLILCIAILSLLSWGLVRYFKPKIGSKAYFLAAIPFVMAGLAAFAEYERDRPSTGPPKVVAAAKLSGLIKSLPHGAAFSISGLSFLDGKLYVGTNLGLLEASGGQVTRLFQFQSRGSVVSGPWLDRADHLLWAMDDETHELVRFDGNSWTRMEAPVPAKGYYSRGDVLEGVRPIGNAQGFWLAAAGTAWRWDSASLKWRQIAASANLPPPPGYDSVNEVIGVLPIGQTALLIVRHEPMAFLVHGDSGFRSDEAFRAAEPISSAVVRDGAPFLADTWAVSEDAGYICTKKQSLIRVTTERAAPLDAPGACEAVANDDAMNLLVSIRSKGVYKYADGKWTLVAATPYPSGAGEYWTFLATSRGQLALAIDGKPVGADIGFFRNAPTSLWILKGGNFARVVF